MKVLITGATGFIGKNLAQRLIQEAEEPICTGRNLLKLGPLASLVKSIYLDITDYASTLNVLKEVRPDIVVHAAALVESSSLIRLRRVNVEGARNILEACLQSEVKKIIHISSVAVISGHSDVPLTDDLPLKANNNYGQSKLEAEQVCLEYRKKGLKIAILRPCMVYGENEPHLLGLFARLLRWRLFPIVGEGKNRLHLVGVDNVVDVIMSSFKKDEAYDGTFLVADKEALPIKDVLCYMAKVLDAKPPICLPGALLHIFRHVPVLSSACSLFLKDRVYSIDRLKESLGYIPRVSVYDGLAKAMRSFQRK